MKRNIEKGLVEELGELYKKTVNESISDIKRIMMKSLGVRQPAFLTNRIEEIMNQYSDFLVEKWASGRKYLRTVFVKEAFGDKYPKKYLKLSISLDVMVNILDDLVDDTLNKEIRLPLVEELGRAISIYNYEKVEEELKQKVGSYFNKLLSIFFLEKIYERKIRQESDQMKVIEYAIQQFDCRSLDIDIFTEIALSTYNGSGMTKKEILRASRLFRAINLLKKDIKDIKRDTIEGIETFVTYASSKKKLREYLESILVHYLKELEKIKSNKNEVIGRFYLMTKQEMKEIRSLLQLNNDF